MQRDPEQGALDALDRLYEENGEGLRRLGRVEDDCSEVIQWSSFSEPVTAILDAYFSRMSVESCHEKRLALADALRVVTAVVAPIGYEKVWQDGRMEEYEKENPVREKLLAIANELET